MDFFDDFDRISRSVVGLLVGPKQFGSLLPHIPHTPFCDLFRIFAVLQEDHLAIIRNEYLALWQTDAETLARLANENSPRLLGQTFQSLSSVIFQEMRSDGTDAAAFPGIDPDTELYVLSNPQRAYGASVILYPGALQAISRQLQSDLYLIPASVHEMLVVPSRQSIPPEELLWILHHNNESVLAPTDYLSGSLYFYSAEDDSVRIWSGSCDG